MVCEPFVTNIAQILGIRSYTPLVPIFFTFLAKECGEFSLAGQKLFFWRDFSHFYLYCRVTHIFANIASFMGAESFSSLVSIFFMRLAPNFGDLTWAGQKVFFWRNLTNTYFHKFGDLFFAEIAFLAKKEPIFPSVPIFSVILGEKVGDISWVGQKIHFWRDFFNTNFHTMDVDKSCILVEISCGKNQTMQVTHFGSSEHDFACFWSISAHRDAEIIFTPDWNFFIPFWSEKGSKHNWRRPVTCWTNLVDFEPLRGGDLALRDEKK